MLILFWMSKAGKKHKQTLSVATIAVVIFIIILLPKRQDTQTQVEPPRTGVRYVPAPTPTPVETLMMIDPSRELPEVILPRDLQ